MVYPVLPVDHASKIRPSPPYLHEPAHPLPFPEEITEMIADHCLAQRSSLNYKTFLTILLQKHGTFMKGLRIHPDYPFLNVFHIHDLFRFPKEALVFFWYLFESYTIAISFNAAKLLSYVFHCQFNDVPSPGKNVYTLLQWFLPGHQWVRRLNICQKEYAVFMFRRPVTYLTPSAVRQTESCLYHSPLSFLHEWTDTNPSNNACRWTHPELFFRMRRSLAHANKVNPASINNFIMGSSSATWSDLNPDASKWKKACQEWEDTHLVPIIDTSDESNEIGEPSQNDNGTDDDDAACSGLNKDNPVQIDEENDDESQHFDPYEDDPSHPDSHWK